MELAEELTAGLLGDDVGAHFQHRELIRDAQGGGVGDLALDDDVIGLGGVTHDVSSKGIDGHTGQAAVILVLHGNGKGEGLGVVVAHDTTIVLQRSTQLLFQKVDVSLRLAAGDVKALGQTGGIGEGVARQLLVEPLDANVGGYAHSSYLLYSSPSVCSTVDEVSVDSLTAEADAVYP